MAEVLTVADLELAKKHDTFHGEVITGKAGAVAGGADIDTATNTVTGQVQTTLPKVLRDVGFKPASYNFVTGGTLGVTDADKCIYNPAPAGDDNWYSWGGNLPHTVAPGSDPAAVGSGYAPRTDVIFRAEITPSVFEAMRRSYADAGFTLVDGSFEEGGTLTSSSDALLHKASGKAYSGPAGHVAAGTSPGSGGFTDESGALLRTQILRNVNLRQIFLSDYCLLDGSSDDSSGFNAALASAYALFDSNPSAGKVTIVNDGLVILWSNISVNVTKVGFKGGAINTKAGSSYANNRLFDFNNGATPVPLSSYNNRQVPIFDGVILMDLTGLKINCFHMAQTSGDPNSSVALQNFRNTTFHTFGKIFTHGDSGWGTEWYSCSSRGCDSWMELIVASDTYERHSFFGCIWHNSSGVAFTCANINGRIYWYGGSCDYSSKLADMSAGLLTYDGHIEFRNRTGPLVTLTGSGQIKLGGLLAILTDSSEYTLIEQASDFQLIVDDLFIVTDGATVLGRLTNKRYSGKPTTNTTGAERFISNSLNISPDMRLPSVNTTGTGLSVAQSSAEMTITSTAAAGAAKSAIVSVRIPSGSKKAGWNIAYANTSASTLYLEKYFQSENGLISQTISAGSLTFAASSSGNLSSVEMQSVPAWADKIVFVLNLGSLGTTGSLALSSLGLFNQ